MSMWDYDPDLNYWTVYFSGWVLQKYPLNVSQRGVEKDPMRFEKMIGCYRVAMPLDGFFCSVVAHLCLIIGENMPKNMWINPKTDRYHIWGMDIHEWSRFSRKRSPWAVAGISMGTPITRGFPQMQMAWPVEFLCRIWWNLLDIFADCWCYLMLCAPMISAWFTAWYLHDIHIAVGLL